MRLPHLVTLFSCLWLCNCGSAPENPYQKILFGDWKILSRDSNFTANSHNSIQKGYRFEIDGNCTNKLGYYKKVVTRIPGFEKAVGDRINQETTYFLGTQTRYSIEADSLRIFDLVDSLWTSYYIRSIDEQKLILQSLNGVETFSRINYPADTSQFFNEIVVTGSGCYGTCPVNNTIIRQQGPCIYSGERYSNKNGYYSFTISPDQFNRISQGILLANIRTLNNKYESTSSDAETISITVLKDGKIVKTIEDYGSMGPPELIWCYESIRNYYQLVKLDSITTNQLKGVHEDILEVMLQVSLHLSKSEEFYLHSLLRNARETLQPFKPKYQIGGVLVEEKGFSVKTDGRFFSIQWKKDYQKTLDIGFNFFELNGIARRFKNNVYVKIL